MTASTRLSMPWVEPFAVDEMLGDLQDAAVHRQVVVPGGDDQVGPADQALLVDLVVVDQRAARGFAAPTPSRRWARRRRARAWKESPDR